MSDQKSDSKVDGRPKSQFPEGKIVIEFDNRQNGKVCFKPLQKYFRGAFSVRNMVGAVGPATNHPDTPGMHLDLIPRHGQGRVFDPLEKNPELLDRAHKAGSKGRVWDEQKYSLDAHGIKTWLAEMIELAEGNMIRVVEGSLPTRQELEDMPGRRAINQFDNSPIAPKFEGDPDPRERAALTGVGG